MIYELVTVWVGHPRYEELVGPLRADADLLATMWQEAESRLDEAPGKRWCLAVVEHDGQLVAGAWAAAIVLPDGTLKCTNSYERPNFRGHGLYMAAYRHRHSTIVRRHGGPAITYVYAQPLGLHLADGWNITDEGDSDEPDAPSHHWYELRR